MGILNEIFGPSKREIWTNLSEQTNSRFVEGGLFQGPDKVIAKHSEWMITLDTYTVSSGKTSTTYTRIRAPYVNADGFRFTIYRSGIFSDIGEFLGFTDIKIGDEQFDEDFVIKSSEEQKVQQLLNDAGIRNLVNQQPRFHLEVKDDEGWFGTTFPDGVDELYFRVPEVIKDIEELKGLFEIFAAILDRLCVLGSAYKDDPRVEF